MQTIEITRTLPDIDADVATQLGDDILIGSAKGERVKRVGKARDGGRSGIQSHTARAWTKGGSVD